MSQNEVTRPDGTERNSVARFFGRNFVFRAIGRRRRRRLRRIGAFFALFGRTYRIFLVIILLRDFSSSLLPRLSVGLVIFTAAARAYSLLLGRQTHRWCVGPCGVSPCCGFQKCTSLTSVGVPAFSCSSIFSWLVFWSPSGLCGALGPPVLVT